MRRAEVSEARLESALLQMAELTAEHGAVLRPIYDRIERELLDMRSNDPRVRARSLVRSAPAAHVNS